MVKAIIENSSASYGTLDIVYSIFNLIEIAMTYR